MITPLRSLARLGLRFTPWAGAFGVILLVDVAFHGSSPHWTRIYCVVAGLLALYLARHLLE